jgi:hypothetical protein
LTADAVCFEAFTHFFSLTSQNSDNDIKKISETWDKAIDLGQIIKKSQRIFQLAIALSNPKFTSHLSATARWDRFVKAINKDFTGEQTVST